MILEKAMNVLKSGYPKIILFGMGFSMKETIQLSGYHVKPDGNPDIFGSFSTGNP
jgi:hypothetical protein